MTTVSVTTSGPIFDGTAAWILTQGIEDARRRYADFVLEQVQGNTNRFRNPTGRYKSMLKTEHQIGISRVRPGRLPYVTWLEGTSTRNQTTRFKGYHVFRDARNTAEAQAVPMMEEALAPVIARLNG